MESMVDFLHQFKDNHPCSDPMGDNKMDVFNNVMQFMTKNKFEPSSRLKMKYAMSEFTKTLNNIPSYETLRELISMNKYNYDQMKKRLELFAPFVYYFDPKAKIKIRIDSDSDSSEEVENLKKGFFINNTNKMEGAGMHIVSEGRIYQGYYKESFKHYYGRIIWKNGDVYEGDWSDGCYHGKGVLIHNDKSKEIGTWVNGKREGTFELIDRYGGTKIKIYKDDEIDE